MIKSALKSHFKEKCVAKKIVRKKDANKQQASYCMQIISNLHILYSRILSGKVLFWINIFNLRFTFSILYMNDPKLSKSGEAQPHMSSFTSEMKRVLHSNLNSIHFHANFIKKKQVLRKWRTSQISVHHSRKPHRPNFCQTQTKTLELSLMFVDT